MCCCGVTGFVSLAGQPSLSSPRGLTGNTISVFGTASCSDTLGTKCQMGLLWETRPAWSSHRYSPQNRVRAAFRLSCSVLFLRSGREVWR